MSIPILWNNNAIYINWFLHWSLFKHLWWRYVTRQFSCVFYHSRKISPESDGNKKNDPLGGDPTFTLLCYWTHASVAMNLNIHLFVRRVICVWKSEIFSSLLLPQWTFGPWAASWQRCCKENLFLKAATVSFHPTDPHWGLFFYRIPHPVLVRPDWSMQTNQIISDRLSVSLVKLPDEGCCYIVLIL